MALPTLEKGAVAWRPWKRSFEMCFRGVMSAYCPPVCFSLLSRICFVSQAAPAISQKSRLGNQYNSKVVYKAALYSRLRSSRGSGAAVLCSSPGRVLRNRCF